MFTNFSRKIFLALVVFGILTLGFSVTQAALIEFPAGGINPSIPGTNEATQAEPNPVGIIGNLFQFALLIGGLLAFIMIVYGGIEYAASGDSGSGQKEAKDRIQQALLGLLLLAGSFILLQTINPQLTKLEFPTLDKIKETNVLFPTLTDNATKIGGRCLNNQCEAGAFCFKDDRCYKNIGCSTEDNEIYPQNENDYCESSLQQATGVKVDATCNVNNVCMLYGTFETYKCPSGSDIQCASNEESCVGGFCKFYGMEGAKSKNGKCAYAGLEPNEDGICVRVSANDIPCGDQTGKCEQGSCQADRANIGKFKCSTSQGADGICPYGTTAQDCVLKYGQAGGGYCHQQFCYSNGVGPFP